MSQADDILQFADNLPGPYGYESSVKFTELGYSSRRFLVSFPKVALEFGVDLQGLLSRLSLPELGFQCLPELLAFGDMLHLGYEEDTLGQCARKVCKFYVEAAGEVRQQWQSKPDLVLDQASTRTKAMTVHRACKWQVGEQALIQSFYDWLPCKSVHDLMANMQSLCAFWSDDLSTEPLFELLSYLAQRCPVSDLQLLRVSEAGSPRLSFDLNVYDADCTVEQIAPYVQSLLGKHTPSSFQWLPSLGIGQQRCGHLAAGTSRTGEPFITLYYGGQERGGFSRQS